MFGPYFKLVRFYYEIIVLFSLPVEAVEEFSFLPESWLSGINYFWLSNFAVACKSVSISSSMFS
jgi:hypothetical protein